MAEQSSTLFSVHRSWKIALAVAVIMVLLALLGVGLSTTNRAVAPTYWISLVPLYGVLCVAVAWSRSPPGHGGPRLVMRQVLHWLGIAAALGVDFYIRGTGQETGEAAGFNALLLLAVGCYLAGVHLEWLFSLVGLLLTVALVAVVKADQYVWLIVIVGVVAVAAMIWLMRLLVKSGEHNKPAGQSTSTAS